MDPSRRLFFRGLTKARAVEPVLRPPWAIPEAEFVLSCTRCDACAKACPQAIVVRGDGGFPELSFASNGCTFCGQCVDACTTGALARLPGQDAWTLRVEIGDKCLAYRNVECRVCGENCDTAAIRFRPVLGGVSSPIVDLDACTGCGVCASICPGQAIRVKAPTYREGTPNDGS